MWVNGAEATHFLYREPAIPLHHSAPHCCHLISGSSACPIRNCPCTHPPPPPTHLPQSHLVLPSGGWEAWQGFDFPYPLAPMGNLDMTLRAIGHGLGPRRAFEGPSRMNCRWVRLEAGRVVGSGRGRELKCIGVQPRQVGGPSPLHPPFQEPTQLCFRVPDSPARCASSPTLA